jgi:hypothetical protein
MSSEKAANKTFRVNAGDIEAALKQGFPISCATCVHFYAACAAGLPSCGKTLCGGPIVGRDFPEYKGQIPRNKFEAICLMCGSVDLACHVVVAGKEQRFGLCKEHEHTFTGVVTNPENPLPQSQPLVIPLQ